MDNYANDAIKKNTNENEKSATLFFYKNNFIRIKTLILEKNYEQAKSKVRLPVPQNIRKSV